MTTVQIAPDARGRIMQLLGLLGLLLVLLLGVWGIVKIISALPAVLRGAGASIEVPLEESLSITAPQGQVESGASAGIIWTHDGRAASGYAYTLAFSCTGGLSVKTQTASGAMTDVPCGVPFNYTSASNSIAITPTLSGSAPITTTVTVTAARLDTGTVTASAQRVITIVPKPEAPAPVVHTANTASNPYGSPDLAVRIISTGYTDYAGAYTAGAYPYSHYYAGQPRMRAAVRFEIKNAGNKTVPYGWLFTATLPQNSPYGAPYQSAPQQALGPGDGIIYTIAFDTGGYQSGCGISGYPCDTYPTPVYNVNNTNCFGNCIGQYAGYCDMYPPAYRPQHCDTAYPQYGGYNTITIAADPYNAVAESNEYNNRATAQLPVYPFYQY